MGGEEVTGQLSAPDGGHTQLGRADWLLVQSGAQTVCVSELHFSLNSVTFHFSSIFFKGISLQTTNHFIKTDGPCCHLPAADL